LFSETNFKTCGSRPARRHTFVQANKK
jgi:hypothetical protein